MIKNGFINKNMLHYPEVPLLMFDSNVELNEYVNGDFDEYYLMTHKAIEYAFYSDNSIATIFIADVVGLQMPIAIREKDFIKSLKKSMNYYAQNENYEDCIDVQSLINEIEFSRIKSDNKMHYELILLINNEIEKIVLVRADSREEALLITSNKYNKRVGGDFKYEIVDIIESDIKEVISL